MELALIVAERRGCLPVKTRSRGSTADHQYMRVAMADPRVEQYGYNAQSSCLTYFYG